MAVGRAGGSREGKLASGAAETGRGGLTSGQGGAVQQRQLAGEADYVPVASVSTKGVGHRVLLLPYWFNAPLLCSVDSFNKKIRLV